MFKKKNILTNYKELSIYSFYSTNIISSITALNYLI